MGTKFKTLISVLTAAIIAASLTACQSSGESSSDIPSLESGSSSTDSLNIPSSESSLNGSSSNTSSGQSSENVSSISSDISAPLAILPENGEGILIAYFSRFGNTNYPDDVDASTSASIVIDNGRFGTTEYVAKMIQETVGGDIHLIETVTPYTADFDELRDVNHSEMASNYLPALEKIDLDISKYDMSNSAIKVTVSRRQSKVKVTLRRCITFSHSTRKTISLRNKRSKSGNCSSRKRLEKTRKLFWQHIWIVDICIIT